LRSKQEYAELHCRSFLSFLAGSSAPEDLIARADHLGYRALAITDIDGVYGAPRGHHAARACAVDLIVGSEITVADDLAPPVARRSRGNPMVEPGHRIVLLVASSAGYANLCRLITVARTRCAKGSAWVTWDEVADHAADLVALSGGGGGPIDAAWRRGDLETALAWARRLVVVFGDRAHIELTHHLRPGDDQRIADLAQLAVTVGAARVITQDARFATSDLRRIYDVQTCIREKTTLAAAGRLLAENGERYLHTSESLWRRFGRRFGDALERTVEIAGGLRFSLDELRYRFPPFDLPGGETPFSMLYRLAQDGARRRYQPMTPRAAAQIAHELSLIEKMNLAGYFLIVWDIVKFCRGRGILCQGRGSAANSAVCYALGITAVDPVGMELLFERFLSEERDEMPDIDLDIASDRREEVIQYVYRRFGLERCAMACNVISYHARSAIRDVGKAFGLSQAQINRAAVAMDRHMPDWSPQGVATNHSYGGVPRDARRELLRGTGLDPDDPNTAAMLDIARAFEGFPRHLGIHSGGLVIAAGPTWEVVPVENATMEQRTVVQWDKDDLNSLGIVKIDLLGLGMLTAIDKAIAEIRRHQGVAIDLAHLPADDRGVYDMICEADTVGTFQIESRAQMNMLPRLKPRCFYDLVVEVAIIRPGPIQGDMIHPYLRRRNGDEPVTFEHPALEPVLRRTLGVPLFQEQGMKLAITCAGFTPAEADELRRAMGHKRSHARMAALKEKLLSGMLENGISAELAARLYAQLCAFADYGFPESHSASFALIVYASCYLKRYYPAAFLAGLLNAQPMGFYSPNSLVADARRHGVEVLSPCARRSGWESRLEGSSSEPAVRLGLAEIRGLGDRYRERYEAERGRAPFVSLIDFAQRSGFPHAVLARMAAADAFASFGVDRRRALWQVAMLPPDFGAAPLLDRAEIVTAELERESPARLAPMDTGDQLVADFAAMGISTDNHPMAMLRAELDRRGIRSAAGIYSDGRDGERATLAGMVITRQRPGSAKGMMFMTVEDETGLANLVLTPPVFERYRQIARGELLILAQGKLEREGRVINLLVDHLERLRAADAPTVPSRDFR
jgi:error-prone DNA polymerase